MALEGERTYLRDMTETKSASQVLIAGGGVAALETLMALRDLAGDRVDVTLIAPETTFTYRPMKVAEPFSQGHAQEYGLVDIAREHGARFIRGSIAEVHTEEKVVRCASGAHVPYDQLVLATGAKAVPAYRAALTFGEDPSEERLHGMLADLEQGYVKRIAFVVPGEAVWTLPLYEIALMTARQAWGMGMDRVRFTLVTPEERPLAMFGGPASQAVAEMLAAEGIEFVGASYPTVGRGYVIADPGGRRIDVERVVSLPVLDGRRLAGVPADATGFIPVDAYGRVRGVAGVYAAGDATNFPIKQGGLATQQADAVAQTVAAEVGAGVDPEPFRPVLRGLLLTGGDDRYMRHSIAGGAGEGEVSGHTLWWPPTKIAGRYLSGYLFDRDDAQTIEDIRSGHLEVEIPLDAHVAAGQS
jgi:sulfide:quinone oxidoreductase